MSETTPIPAYKLPEYSQEQVFSPERETGLAPISGERVEELGDVIEGDLEEFEKTRRDPKLTWSDRFDKMLEIGKGELSGCQTQQEAEVVRVFWGMGRILEQIPLRNQLSIELDDIDNSSEPDYARRAEIFHSFDHLNIASARWQEAVMKTILAMGESPEGKALISRFWQQFEDLSADYLAEGQKEARHLRNGVLGAVTTIQILESLGMKTYFAFADQDAIEKIDLWGQRDGQTFAFQIKSHSRGNLRVSGELVTERMSTLGLTGDERREAEGRNRLLTKSRKYADNWSSKANRRVDVHTLWVDLDRMDGTRLLQDEETGRPRLTSELQGSSLAQAIQAALQRGGPGVVQ